MKRGRHKKVRFVQRMPKVVQFSPRGKPGRPDEVLLTIDEFEAIKLADWQGFEQDQGALVMRISRPSFGRILREARKKIADALVNAKIIKIGVGDVQVGVLSKDFTPAELATSLPQTDKMRTMIKATLINSNKSMSK